MHAMHARSLDNYSPTHEGGNTQGAGNMLQADKTAFVATLQKQSLEIRQTELKFYLERYANMSSTASIIAGFAFTGLATTRMSEYTPPWLAAGYWVCGAICMTTTFYVVVIAAFSSVMGQRLALQGGSASAMATAVRVLEAQRLWVFAIFVTGLSFQAISAVFIVSIRIGGLSWPVWLIIAAYLVCLSSRWVDISDAFSIPEDELVTGKMVVEGSRSRHVLDLEAMRVQTGGGRQALSEGRPDTLRGRQRSLLSQKEGRDGGSQKEVSFTRGSGGLWTDEQEPSSPNRRSSARRSSAEAVVSSVQSLGRAISTSLASISTKLSPQFVPLCDETDEEDGEDGEAEPGDGGATPEEDAAAEKLSRMASEDQVLFGGFLFKRGLKHLPGREASFKRRYFIVLPGRLWYYHSWEDHELGQRAINAKRPIRLEQYAVHKTSELGLKLVPHGSEQSGAPAAARRVWELRAANRSELEAWVHMLSAQASRGPAYAPNH